MRAWTIQDPRFLDELNKGAPVFQAAPLADPDYEPAYRWMVKQMVNRGLTKPKRDITPIWMWTQWMNENRKRPDLRYSCHGIKGKPYVRIELDIPSDRILVSDHSTWHHVLNQYYLPADEADDDLFERLHGAGRFAITDSCDRRRRILDSWQRIFDMSHCDPYIANPLSDKHLQATTWSIDPTWVVSTTPFIAR